MRGGNLDFRLPRAATLRGRVVDGDDRPVPNVTVAANVESPFDASGERFTTTDAEGWFEVAGLDAETGDLWVSLHVHETPDCRARGLRRFRGKLPPDQPFILRLE